MKKTLLLPLLACIFIFAQCKKDKNSPEPDNPYGLPNATQTGANVFACRVNGVNWVSGKGIYKMGGEVSNDTLSCWGIRKDTDHLNDLVIQLRGGAAQGGQYSLSATGSNYIRYVLGKTCNGYLGSNFLTLFSTSGSVTISKIDRINKIISGTFNCKVPVPTCDTLYVTDGRFDIRYY